MGKLEDKVLYKFLSTGIICSGKCMLVIVALPIVMGA